VEGDVALKSSKNEPKSEVDKNTICADPDLSISTYYPVVLISFPYSDKDRIEGGRRSCY